ncbi:MAG: hypothetical protein LJE87_17275 [Deltaproteobacteria bacterium]|jgi:hypothetical protein|nr:hypothetical protein [Deltaproteobacteria bacterium]
MLKRWFLLMSMLMLLSLVMTPQVVAAESAQAFRQKNGLQVYAPPVWFLEGYFIAREKNPGYIFGTVQDFVKTLGATTTWLIEDLELKRLEVATAEGKKPEYSLYLEAVAPERTEYWVFVVLPHESPQAWFDARRAYHGRKAEGYYGKTESELERALSQGLKIKAELRFLIEKGDLSLQSPEDVILKRDKFQPVFDLSAGRWLRSAAKTK